MLAISFKALEGMFQLSSRQWVANKPDQYVYLFPDRIDERSSSQPCVSTMRASHRPGESCALSWLSSVNSIHRDQTNSPAVNNSIDSLSLQYGL